VFCFLGENQMKTIDFSSIPYDSENISFGDRIQGMMQYGFSWPKEMKSQEVVSNAFEKVLGSNYTLLRNVTLIEEKITFPMILVGPQGVMVIYNSPVAGVYQAKGEGWAIMDTRAKKFKPVKPNLVTRTALLAKQLQSFLAEAGYSVEVGNVLALTNPGSHVETQRSIVRVILIDALERFASRYMQEDQILSKEDMYQIAEILNQATIPQEDESLPEESEPRQINQVESQITQTLTSIQSKLNFSRRQWILLGAFAIADVLVLIIFVLFILFTA